MNIEIDDKLKKYLKNKHINDLTIELAEFKTCWIQPDIPLVKRNKPNFLEKYTYFKIDDINVYIDKDIKTINNKIIIKLKNYFFFKDIVVKGIKEF